MVTVKEHPMDNCQLFVQLRNMFQNYDKQTKRLTTFLYWSGNEEHIDELCAQVVQLLLEHELVTQEPHPKRPDELQTLPAGPEAISHLRGVLIFLLVNTAVGQDNWSLQCQHLCQQLPLLPQFLTMGIAMRCGLQQPLLEFLECGPRWATIQYFGALNEALAHITSDRMDALTWISGTLKAAGHALIYQSFADKNQQLVREMGRMLQRHLLDSAERLQELRPTPRKVYLALAMALLLEVILEVLGDPKALGKPAHFHTYSDLSPGLADTDHHRPDPTPYAQILLDALQRIVEAVSVTVFMYWVEMPSPKILYNYQALICSQSAALLEAVRPYAELEKHAVCTQLKSFAQTALSLEDILAGMSMGELLTFLDGDVSALPEEQLVAVLEQLLSRPIALGNEECVETVANHVELLTEKHAKFILTHLGQVSEARKAMQLDIKEEPMDVDEANEDADDEAEAEEYSGLLHTVLLPIFTKCSVPEKIELLKFRDDLGITKDFPYEAPNHLERRISFFNNLNSHSPAVEDRFLIFCYERPDESWLALAKLAMSHTRFASFFWRVALHSAGHSVHQMTNIAGHLLKDDQLLLKGNGGRFLLSLYVHPLILNGLMKLGANRYRVSMRDDAQPYGMQQLKAAQSGFLEACAGGLQQFTEPLNVPLLRRLLHLFAEMAAAEQNVIACGRRQLRQIRGEEAVEQARNYKTMHELLPKWRQAHIPLVTQLLMTIDALRWDLTNFERERVNALGMALQYWRHNTHCLMFLDADFRQKIDACAANLTHKEFLTDELQPPEDPSYRTAFIRRVTQASAWEATKLFRQSLEARTDCVLFLDLAQAVEQANCEAAEEAYIFLFGCHLAAIKSQKGLKSHLGDRAKKLGERLASIVDSSPQGTVSELRKQLDLLSAGNQTAST